MKQKHSFEFVNGEGLCHHHTDGTYAEVETTGTAFYRHGTCTDCGEERIRPSSNVELAGFVLSAVLLLAVVFSTPDGQGLALFLLSLTPAVATLAWPDYIVREGDQR